MSQEGEEYRSRKLYYQDPAEHEERWVKKAKEKLWKLLDAAAQKQNLARKALHAAYDEVEKACESNEEQEEGEEQTPDSDEGMAQMLCDAVEEEGSIFQR